MEKERPLVFLPPSIEAVEVHFGILHVGAMNGHVATEVKELSTEAEEIKVQNATRRKHPHGLRREEILRQHPEIAKLYGLYPVSAMYIVLLVALQWLLAVYFTKYFPWYVNNLPLFFICLTRVQGTFGCWQRMPLVQLSTMRCGYLFTTLPTT